MKRIVQLIGFAFLAFAHANGQEEVARFENDSVDFDTTEGWFFYNTYFDSGDFDVSRMPCSLSGSFGIIKHMMEVTDQEGNQQTVVIVLIDHGNAAAYIVADAFLSEEILYAPKR